MKPKLKMKKILNLILILMLTLILLPEKIQLSTFYAKSFVEPRKSSFIQTLLSVLFLQPSHHLLFLFYIQMHFANCHTLLQTVITTFTSCLLILFPLLLNFLSLDVFHYSFELMYINFTKLVFNSMGMLLLVLSGISRLVESKSFFINPTLKKKINRKTSLRV